jgi:chaperone LolA
MTVMFSFGPAGAAGQEEMVSRIQKAYEGISDIRGGFTQKSTIKDLKRTDTYRGDFFIKPPLKMKWMYKGDAAQDITVNNDMVLIYKKGDSQAYRSRFDKATYGQTPVALLGGFGKIRDEFTISAKGDSLTLKPKKPLGNISSITVAVSDEGFPIRSFRILDSRSNVIEIELRDIVLNSGLREGLFDLSVPKGVSVYDQGL